MQMMKRMIAITAALLSITVGSTLAADKTESKDAKAKPYPLDKCIVSDEKLGGEMGEPYVFTHEGQEIKLCCKPCQKDFNKNPKKYLKKLEKADKKK